MFTDSVELSGRRRQSQVSQYNCYAGASTAAIRGRPYPAEVAEIAESARARVFLHIGVPKSGTSFLQATLRENADRLAAQGIHYPTRHQHGLFHAALELTGNHPGWGVPDRRVRGSWAALCAGARRRGGISVFSNELFSNVKAEKIGPALAHLEGTEVHVVVTARDLARQLPAEWQEGVKHGRGLRFAAFLDRIADPERTHPHARKFWRHQDLAAILDRWADHVPTDRVHVVTCPPPGAPRDLLWDRFCSVVGIDPAGTVWPELGANVSLGVTAVDVLRRVNRALGRLDERPPQLRRVLKQSLVNGALRADDSPRVTTPERLVPRLTEITEDWVTRIEKAGYDVVGDLAELTPRITSGPGGAPRVPVRDSRDLAVEAVAVLAREVATLRHDLQRAEARARRHSSPRRRLRRLARRLGRMIRRR